MKSVKKEDTGTDQREFSLFRCCPEAETALLKRMRILSFLDSHGTAGRRLLSKRLGASEREIRADVEFLRAREWISVAPQGVALQPAGRGLLEQLKQDFPLASRIIELEEALAASTPGLVWTVSLFACTETKVHRLSEDACMKEDLKAFLKRRGGLIVRGGQVLREDGSVLYTIPDTLPSNDPDTVRIPGDFTGEETLALINSMSSGRVILPYALAEKLAEKMKRI